MSASYNFSVPVVAEWWMIFISLLWKTHTKKMTFNQNEQHNILFQRVTEDNTRWVWCTSIHIVYKNIVFESYNFSVPVVAEWWMIFISLLWKAHKQHDFQSKMNSSIKIQNEQQNILSKKVAEDNTRWAGCTSIHYTYTYSGFRLNAAVCVQSF